MFTTQYLAMTDVPASFSQDQIAFFRAQFATHVPPEGRGLNEEGFLAAARASIEHAALDDPGDEVLRREFQRLNRNNCLPWASFFQVLQHVRDRARTLARSMSFGRQTRPRNADYVASGEQPTSAEPPVPIMERSFRTLRNGSIAAAHMLGRFFGVTDDSQMGNAESVGWAEVAQQSAQTTTLNFITGGLGNRQYADEGDEIEIHQLNAEPQRSFELLGGSSSDTEDNAFLSEAPPEYYDIVQGSSIPVTIETDQLTTRASVYTGSTDIPPYVAEQPQQPLQPRTPPQQRAAQQQQRAAQQQQRAAQQQQQQGARRRPSVPRQISVTTENMQDFIFDPNEAYAYYLNFVKKEAREQRRRQRRGARGFFGRDEPDRPENGGANVTRQPSVRGGRITDAGVELRPRRKRAGRTKLERQSTLIRQKVNSLPTFFPFFILGITLVQSIATIVAIITGGLAPIGAIPEETQEMTASLSSPSKLDNSTYEESVNPWVGSPIPFLITIGAKFTPCMREDHKINARNARIREERLIDGGVGCCVNGNWIGSTSISDCAHNKTGAGADTEFMEGQPCSQTDLRTLINFRPCCVSLTGRCQLLLELDCEEREGEYHPEADTCSEVNCLSGVCQMGGIPSDDDFPDQSQGNQWWRFLIPLIFHMGIIHLLIIVMIQLYIGIKIERTAGWLRVGLIYIISGIGGNLLSAIFVPYEVQFGASGSLFGLLAVIVVELIQSWQIVDRAWWEFIKIAVVTVVMFGLGTLPYVDNVAHVGGFVNGILAALIFIPYITFGKFDAWRKRILLIIAIPTLIILFLIQLLVFYLVQNSEFCEDCKYFDCIPYRDGLCENDFTNPDPDVA